MAFQHEHTRARQHVLEVLYQSEVTGSSVADILAENSVVDETGQLDEWAMKLALGVEEHRAEIDERISSISQNWVLSRMSIVDRNILRIAHYEMFFDDEIPVGVAINEAVELARRFGQDGSSRFVNGILGESARLEGFAVEDIPVEDDVPAPDLPVGADIEIVPAESAADTSAEEEGEHENDSE